MNIVEWIKMKHRLFFSFTLSIYVQYSVSCPKCNWINSYTKRATNLFHNLLCNVLEMFHFSFFFVFVYKIYCCWNLHFVNVYVCSWLFVIWIFSCCECMYIYIFFMYPDEQRRGKKTETRHNKKHMEYRTPALCYYLCLSHYFLCVYVFKWLNIVNYGYTAVFHIFPQ